MGTLAHSQVFPLSSSIARGNIDLFITQYHSCYLNKDTQANLYIRNPP